MKCKCGNEGGKPLVYPRPITIGGTKKGDEVQVVYMGGFSNQGKCWFCQFPGLTVEDVRLVRARFA